MTRVRNPVKKSFPPSSKKNWKKKHVNERKDRPHSPSTGRSSSVSKNVSRSSARTNSGSHASHSRVPLNLPWARLAHPRTHMTPQLKPHLVHMRSRSLSRTSTITRVSGCISTNCHPLKMMQQRREANHRPVSLALSPAVPPRR